MPMTLPQRFPKLTSIPLRWALVTPFVLQTVGLVALVGYLSYRSGQEAIAKLAYHLMDNVGHQVTQELDHYLQSAHEFNQRQIAAIASGAIDLQDLDRLHRYLILQHRQTDHLTTLLFGTPAGDLRVSHHVSPQDYGISTRLQPGELPFEAAVSEAARPTINQTYSIDAAGNLGRYLETIEAIDGRDRLWYRQAVETGKPGWTEPFQIGTTNLLALNAYAPVYDENRQLLGVFGVNISLNQLSDFLKQVEVGQSGEVFIMERNGQLIATSTPEASYETSGKPDLDGTAEPGTLVFERRFPGDLENSSIQHSYEYLSHTFQDFATLQSPQSLSFSIQGDRYFLAVFPYQDNYGLDWLVVTVIPESEFTAEIQESVRTTVLLCLLALMGAIASGLAISNYITTRILRLNQASRELTTGDLTQQVPTDSSITEVTELAQSFNQMAEQLRHSFQHQVEAKATRQSEARFQQLSAAVPGMIYTCVQHPDGSYKFEYVSSVSRDILELEPDQAIADINLVLDQIHPDDRLVYDARLAHSITSLEPFTLTFRIVTPSGQLKWIESNARPLHQDDGSLAWYGVLLDVSERKQAETALRDSESQLRLALEAAHMGSWDWNILTNQIIWSESLERLMGLQPGAFDGRFETIAAMIHPDDRQQVLAAITRSVEQGEEYSIEFRFVKPDGSIRWALSKGNVSRDQQGRAIQMAGVDVDITDRKWSNQQLAISEARFQKLAATLPGILYTSIQHGDGSIEFTYASSVTSEILEVDVDTILNNANVLFDMFHPDDVLGYRMAVEQSVATMQPFRYEWRIITPSGKTKWIQANARPETLNNQEILWFGVALDVTEQKQVELALQENETRLKEAQRVAQVGSWEFEVATQTSLWSEQMFHITGLDPTHPAPSYEELVQLLPMGDREQLLAVVKRAIIEGIPYDVEHRVGRPDGSMRYVISKGYPIFDVSGQVAKLYGTTLDITERKVIELELQAKTEELNQFFSAALDLLCIADANGYFHRLNPEWENTLGYRLEDLEGSRFIDYVHPDDIDSTLQTIADLANQKQILNFVNRYRCYDGSYRWIEWRSFPVGTLIYATARDITTHRQVEIALRQSERKFKGAFDTITTGMALVSLAGGFQEVNKTLCKLLGYSEEELLRLRLEDVVAPIDQQLDLPWIEMMMAGEIPGYQIEKRFLHKNGHQLWGLFNIALMRDTDDRFLYFIIQIIDISDRKQAESAIARSKAALAEAQQIAHMGNWEFDIQTQTIVWSDELFRMFGLDPTSPEPAYGDYLQFCIHPDDQAKLQQRVEQAITQGTPYTIDYRAVLPDGSVRYHEGRGQVEYDAQGQISRLFGTALDISERKQAEQDLEEAKEAAEAANRAKSAFLANMSHELRTPLNAILGFSQLMQRSAEPSLHYREYISLIHNSGKYLLKLINEILDLSKIESGKLTLELQILDLSEQLQRVSHTLSERIRRKKLQFCLEILPDVPHYIKVDAQKLEQVLLNLLSNAVKFTERGGITLRVSRGTWQHDDEGEKHDDNLHPFVPLLFEVEDTGIGIAPQDLTLIFDPFAQTAAGQQSQEGTGLGLSISRRLVQLLGGDLTVRSVVGQGSTFGFTILVERVPEDAFQLISSDPKQLPMGESRSVIGIVPNQTDYRILIVDDQPENRLLLVRLLEQVGLIVREAMSGKAAIALWKEWHPDLIWMDIRLPDMDGYEVTRQIRALEQETDNDTTLIPPVLRPPTVIIALTAQALPEDRLRALAAGCTDYISKPFHEETLFQKMEEHLGIQFIEATDNQALSMLGLYSSEPPLKVEDLGVMPNEWVAALYEASILCQETALDHLIQQIPSDYEVLIRCLKQLIHDFEFEQIMELAKSYLGSK